MVKEFEENMTEKTVYVLECGNCGEFFTCRCTRDGICHLVIKNRGEVGEMVAEGKCICDACASKDSEGFSDRQCKTAKIDAREIPIKRFTLHERWILPWKIEEAQKKKQDIIKTLKRQMAIIASLHSRLEHAKKDWEKQKKRGSPS